MSTARQPIDVEHAVRQRYSVAARAPEPELCCPVSYDRKYLEVLPDELIERDYGCGDPSKYVQPGETVLDLGSGGGKICYIIAQIVGAEGRVIGIDMNDDMLQLARQYQRQIGDTIGYHNTEFHKGRIQDLALDFERFEAYLAGDPISTGNDWIQAAAMADRLRRDAPMIADDSVDVIVSNCVLNLVARSDRRQLFDEMHRVLRRGGRALISDIVSDEPVPEDLRNDPKLWSGCISGAFTEMGFLQAFAEAGFYGIEILARPEEPWATVEGIEFRSVTVRAFKGKDGPCLDHNQAVIYNGPWRSVTDDDGHVLVRGLRTAVCEKMYKIYTQLPYHSHITPVPPYDEVPPGSGTPFDCHAGSKRDPRETKGAAYSNTSLPDGNCCSGDSCC